MMFILSQKKKVISFLCYFDVISISETRTPLDVYFPGYVAFKSVNTAHAHRGGDGGLREASPEPVCSAGGHQLHWSGVDAVYVCARGNVCLFLCASSGFTFF